MSFSMCIKKILHTINYHKSKREKIIILSVNVEKAYNCVNIEIIQKILNEINSALANFLVVEYWQ